MHDRRDDRDDHGRSRRDREGEHRRHRHEEGCHDRGGGDESREERERGPDTRFLQLEMSELLYAEAESVGKQAFRELLLEEAKDRLRERFGQQITGLAQLAVDELMQDVFASLDIESRIRRRNRDRQSRGERLRGILGEGREEGESDVD